MMKDFQQTAYQPREANIKRFHKYFTAGIQSTSVSVNKHAFEMLTTRNIFNELKLDLLNERTNLHFSTLLTI